MGENLFRLGDWNAMCYHCGRDMRASEAKRYWKGYYVHPACWEPRHPQDFVRAGRPERPPPWTQPEPADQYSPQCSPDGQCSRPGMAIPSCARPSYIHPANTLEI